MSRPRCAEHSDQEHEYGRSGDTASGRSQLPFLGLTLIRRDRKDAEEKPRACGGGLFEIEDVALVRGGAGWEDLQANAGAGGEPGAQASLGSGAVEWAQIRVLATATRPWGEWRRVSSTT